MFSGYEQIDDRTDIVSYFIVQTTFCWKNRFYDYEKSLGVSKGLAIRSAKYGFTSDLVSDHDSNSGDLSTSVRGFFSGVGSLTINRGFLMRRGGAIPSSTGESSSEMDDVESSTLSSHGLLAGRGANSSVVVGSRAPTFPPLSASLDGANRGPLIGLVTLHGHPVSSTIAESEAAEVKTGDVAQQHTVSGDQKTPDTSGVSNVVKDQLPVVPYGDVSFARFGME